MAHKESVERTERTELTELTERKQYLLSLSHENVVDLLIEREKMLISSSYMVDSSDKKGKSLRKKLNILSNELKNSQSIINASCILNKRNEIIIKSLNKKLDDLSLIYKELLVNYNHLNYFISETNKLCTNVYCYKNCIRVHEGHPHFNKLHSEWFHYSKYNMSNFRSRKCYNSINHRVSVCKYLHNVDKIKSPNLDKCLQTSCGNDIWNNVKSPDLNQCLPTSREDDICDFGMNGDSIHDPNITKKQLDDELDEFINDRDIKKID